MRVLVPIDDSRHSQAAIEEIIRRQWPDGTEFRVLCVIDEIRPLGPGPHTQHEQLQQLVHGEDTESAQALVDSAAQRIRVQWPLVKTSSEVHFGYPKETILDLAQEWPADLVAMGSRGHRGLKRFVLGSVSQTVLVHGPCSVLVVTAVDEAGNGQPRTAVSGNILVAVDDSPHSIAVLKWLKRFPPRGDTRWRLVTVIPGVSNKYSDGIDNLHAAAYESKLAQDEANAHAFLERCAANLGLSEGEHDISLEVAQGDTSDEIVKMAAEWPAGLIVMGSRGNQGISKLVLGSISQDVMLQSPCPIVVVKTPSKATVSA